LLGVVKDNLFGYSIASSVADRLVSLSISYTADTIT